MNNGALFKMFLRNRSILQAFFEQFLPEAAAFVDFDELEYVDKGRVTLEGKKRTGDLLVKTRFRGEAAGFLIHLEHQAHRAPDLPWRMLECLVLDQRDYEIPVCPITILSYPDPESGNRPPVSLTVPNKRVLESDFDVNDLARLEERVFVQYRNSAAVARDFFINLVSVPVTREEQELVAGFLSAYQPLSGEQALQLEKETAIIEPNAMREGVMYFTDPFIELERQRSLQQGIEKGIEKGRHEGEVELVLRQLGHRLGTVSVSQKKLIHRSDLPEIEALGESLLDFRLPADLGRWLKKYAS